MFFPVQSLSISQSPMTNMILQIEKSCHSQIQNAQLIATSITMTNDMLYNWA